MIPDNKFDLALKIADKPEPEAEGILGIIGENGNGIAAETILTENKKLKASSPKNKGDLMAYVSSYGKEVQGVSGDKSEVIIPDKSDSKVDEKPKPKPQITGEDMLQKPRPKRRRKRKDEPELPIDGLGAMVVMDLTAASLLKITAERLFRRTVDAAEIRMTREEKEAIAPLMEKVLGELVKEEKLTPMRALVVAIMSVYIGKISTADWERLPPKEKKGK